MDVERVPLSHDPTPLLPVASPPATAGSARELATAVAGVVDALPGLPATQHQRPTTS